MYVLNLILINFFGQKIDDAMLVNYYDSLLCVNFSTLLYQLFAIFVLIEKK